MLNRYINKEENNCNGATYSLVFNSKNDLIHVIWTEKYQTEIALKKRKRISDVCTHEYMCSADVLEYGHDEWWCMGLGEHFPAIRNSRKEKSLSNL